MFTGSFNGLNFRASSSSLWLGGAKFGDDSATKLSYANLKPKKGWYDVVVHGDSFYVGNAFNINGKTVSAEELHKLMIANGYKQGTNIRLISCNAASGQAAEKLSKLSKAEILIAPTAKTKVGKNSKFITKDGSKYKVLKNE